MPLPVAHALIGVSLIAMFRNIMPIKNSYNLMLFVAILSILPDFDYLLNWLKVSGGGWHHDFTHSIIFAFLVGIVAAALYDRFSIKNAFLFGLVVLSHTMIDYLITESNGVELFWPFSDQRYKLEVANPIDYSWDNGSLIGGLVGILKISALELILFAPILVLIVVIKNRIYKKRFTF
jgi:membrane-bound metal-dependent hydrolase YbcI (DUF457 family)